MPHPSVFGYSPGHLDAHVLAFQAEEHSAALKAKPPGSQGVGGLLDPHSGEVDVRQTVRRDGDERVLRLDRLATVAQELRDDA